MFTLAIIGTAGRDGKMTNIVWLETLSYLQNYINNIITLTCTAGTPLVGHITLVSGGAAWIDHLAVVLYLNKTIFTNLQLKLILNLPCAWDFANHQFYDNGSSDWRSNPGKTSNHYHQLFSQKVGFNTLLQLEEAMQTAEVHVYNGFHARNNEIASATVLLAFTWALARNQLMVALLILGANVKVKNIILV